MKMQDLDRVRELAGLRENDEGPSAMPFYVSLSVGAVEILVSMNYDSVKGWQPNAVSVDDEDYKEAGSLADFQKMILDRFELMTNQGTEQEVARDLEAFINTQEPDLGVEINRISRKPFRVG